MGFNLGFKGLNLVVIKAGYGSVDWLAVA